MSRGTAFPTRFVLHVRLTNTQSKGTFSDVAARLFEKFSCNLSQRTTKLTKLHVRPAKTQISLGLIRVSVVLSIGS